MRVNALYFENYTLLKYLLRAYSLLSFLHTESYAVEAKECFGRLSSVCVCVRHAPPRASSCLHLRVRVL
jgi:hypothetical protein